MKKVQGYFVFCMTLAILLGACGTAQTDGMLTNTPEATKAAEVTAPAETSEEITEVPVSVDRVTQTPVDTEIPVTTEKPKAAEATEVPKATATPKPTATPSLPKADTTQGDICYTGADLKVLNSFSVECTPKQEDSVELEFASQYAQVRFALPEAVDSRECTGVTIKMKADTTWLGVSFYGEGFIEKPHSDAVESYVIYTCIKDAVEEHGVSIPDIGDVYGIGLMYTDDVTVIGNYEAVLESITFHMLSGNDVTVPKKIAPDVTESMTLRNTYGKDLGYIGTCVTLAELQNPAILKLIKEQYNSVTSGNDAKMTSMMADPVVKLSVADAKKLGYVIPENYKEAVVPKLNFEVLDETLKICAENGLSYRFHVLLWHEQSLDWFFREGYSEKGAYVSPEVMDVRIEFYVRTIMEHVYNSEYGHIVYAWDVMNEHLHADNNNSSLVRVYGDQRMKPEFLKRVYTIADDVLRNHGIREKVALVFNEYDTYLIVNGRNMAQDILTVLEYINSDGVVCDTVGMQSHMDTNIPIAKRQREAIEAFLDAGYRVQFTEAEVNIQNFTTGKEDQEKYYCEFMKTLLDISQDKGGITGLTFWGHGDTTSWLKEYTPLMFAHIGRPKDVYYKVLQTYVDPDYTKIEEPVEITYKCDELQPMALSESKYTINGDGSMDAEFHWQYDQVRFFFKEPIDMSKCQMITANAKSEYSKVTIMLFGEELRQNEWCDASIHFWDVYGEEPLEYSISPSGIDEVHGIGIMALDDVKDFSKYKATLYSITFHMEPGYQVD